MPKLVFPVVVDKVIILEVLLDKLIEIYNFYGHSLKFPDQENQALGQISGKTKE